MMKTNKIQFSNGDDMDIYLKSHLLTHPVLQPQDAVKFC